METTTCATLFDYQQGFFYMHNFKAFVIPVVEHWLKREIAQWVHHEGSIRRPITPWAGAQPRNYVALLIIILIRKKKERKKERKERKKKRGQNAHGYFRRWETHLSRSLFRYNLSCTCTGTRYLLVCTWYVLSCLWHDAYKRTLAANQKE